MTYHQDTGLTHFTDYPQSGPGTHWRIYTIRAFGVVLLRFAFGTMVPGFK